MAETAKQKVAKTEEFWNRAEQTAAAFERGEDVVAVAIASVSTPDEPLVES